MLIKEAVWEECSCCGKRVRQLEEQVYGCDYCQKPHGEGKSLQITVFYHDKSRDNETDTHEFCCWEHCIKFIETVKTDYFISLPFLSYDEDRKEGIGVNDFLNLFRNKQL